ncbi:hypothetical protein [Actinoplanes sp. NPDC051859]|uniref:hypothetical protein n=1 Tax=Actinoplanes sp. NPDC051859 TaxID=3363909 RepID=UPI0037BAE089
MTRDAGVRDEIVQHATAYRAQVAQIRGDQTLSPLGKRRALEAAYGQVQPVVAELKKQLGRSEHVGRQELERSLFGLPANASAADVVSFRDAADRVAKAKRPEELGELMVRAAAAGDDMLLRAAAGRAWERSREPLASDGWGLLVAEYGAQNPNAGGELEKLAAVSGSRSATERFADRLAMDVARPKELYEPESALSDVALVHGERAELMVR